MAGRRRRRRLIRIRMIAASIAVIVIVLAVLFGVFHIRTLEVAGSERYAADTIKKDLLSNYLDQNTLYFCWKYRVASADPEVPYLESIQAKMLSPGKVRLIVREKALSGAVDYAGNYVYFDNNGTVLEITSNQYEDIPVISGIAMDEPVLYQKFPAQNTAQLRTMLSLTQLLAQIQLVPDTIAFDENSNIGLTLGSVLVKLGQDEYLEEKIANLAAIFPEVQSRSGILNMETFTGKNEKITFKDANETESGGTDGQGTEAGTDDISSGEADLPQEGDGTLPEPLQDGSAEGSGEQTQGEASMQDSNSDPNASGDGQAEEPSQDEETTGVSSFMVFDSSGTLRYDAHVVNGQVVDAYGNPIDGCSVDENGNVKDAYWNVIDPKTGQLAQ